MYDSILLPVDESDETAPIVEHAAAIARWSDATIEVLHVADSARDSVTLVEADVVDALARRGEELVDGVSASLAELGVESRTDVVQGDPASTIVDYAETYDHDLIVLPTHGRTGLSRYLLGSVTEKIVRLSAVPVLTARIEPDEQLGFPYEEMLLPTDGSPSARAAATHGLSLAESLDARVHVVGVTDTESLGPDLRSSAGSALETVARNAVDDVAASASERTVVETHVRHGDPATEIIDFVEEHGVDSVVMGTVGRRGVDRILLGSVAEKTVRSAPVPVITVPE